jgi:predicted amidohydrolase YtcJ
MPSSAPSLAIVNARVWTGDPRRPWADAVLVHGSTIEAVGSSAEVKKRCSEATLIVDARRLTLACSPAAWGDAGLLRRGAPADLVVVRADLARVTVGDLRDAEVALEIRGGQVAFDHDGLVR